MKYAWIENGKIRDVAQSDPKTIYHPNVAINYSVLVPDNSQNGDLWDGITLTKPTVSNPPIIPPTIIKTHFLLTFTSAERVKARSLRATDPTLDDFWKILEEPSLDTINLALPSTQNGIEYTLNAVKSGGLSTLNVATRKAEILAGKLQ